MSEDLLRTARQLVSELEATEAYLRSLAIEALPYSGVLAMERRANQRCAELITAMGGTAFEFALDDTTDELLMGMRRRAPLVESRQTTSSQILETDPLGVTPSFDASFESFEALDDGPEGAADQENDLLSDELHRPEPDTTELQTNPRIAVVREAEPARHNGVDSYVSYDRPPAPDPVDDDPATEARIPAKKKAEDVFDNLVTFDDPVVSATPETVVRTVTPPGTSRSADLRSPIRSDVPVSDVPTSGSDSFDLIPDVPGGPDFADFEDEEVTFVKPASALDGGPPARNISKFADDVKATPGPKSAPPPAPAKAPPTPAPAAARPAPSKPAPTPPPAPPPTRASPPAPAKPESSDRQYGSTAPTAAPRTAAPPPPAAPAKPPDTRPAASVGVSTAKAGASARPAPAPAAPARPPAAPAAPAAAVRTAAAKPPGKAPAPAGRVTSGLYGGSSVPTIRESDEPRPRAAAVQLNASGSGGRVIGSEEEDEPIEIGAADFEDDMESEGGGFAIKLQQMADVEDDDDEAGEISEEDLEVIQPAQVIPAGPSAEEVRQMALRAQNAAAGGDLQAAADLYSDVIDADPDNVPAHVARGRLYLDLGDYSRAMSDFMVAEDIAPNDPEPQVAIGDLYFARKDYAKAIEYFNDALKFSPNHPMAHCRRGISHYYRKNYKEAVDDLLRAERLDPDIPNIQTYVSMARKKVKR